MMREIWWILVGTFPVYKIPCWANISHPKPKPTAKRCGLNSLSEINLHQKKKKKKTGILILSCTIPFLLLLCRKKEKNNLLWRSQAIAGGANDIIHQTSDLGDAATRR